MDILTIKLPAISDVGPTAYHKLYWARRRAAALMKTAEATGVDTSMIRRPTTADELEPFVVAMKALIRATRDTARNRAAYAAKKQQQAEAEPA